ncbi:methyl-accepting chemotaxis protein [Paenibacillus filicis]|uniref:Methyl-accepting chemotaxis protein n=2 Tax=Paenibacillus filicis TaxID=669464 RepID=A0ABU9DFE6_9BACL
MSIRQKLLCGLSGMLLFFIAVASFNLYQVNQIQAELDTQNDKVDLKLMALELKEMVQELNIIASGLEISKNTDFIPKYNEKRATFEQMVKRVGETADTDEKTFWRSKLILLTGEYTNTFDVAAKVIKDPNLSKTDIEKNMEYLYTESQALMHEIFIYVDNFYNSYSGDAAVAVENTQNKLNSTVYIMIAAIVAIVLISLAIAATLIRALIPPIRRLQSAVQLVASGDLRVRVNHQGNDELGALSRDFDRMTEQVQAMLTSTQSIASSLSSHSSSFKSFSGSTASSNKEILKSIQEIAVGASQQASYMELSTTIIGELSEQVRGISAATETMQQKNRIVAFNTHTGSKSMDELRQAAQHSEGVLQQVFEAMSTLNHSSSQIGSIVASISEISNQTNVLALNAAIEAARAGVHGKGFSVIAEEVRQLSSQTRDSSKQIILIVGSLQKQIKGLEHNLTEAKESLDLQNGKMNENQAAYSEIRHSMDELSDQISLIHESMASMEGKNNKIVETIQHVAAIAEETAAGVQEVSASSQQQDSAIHQIATESDDILQLAQQLFAEINQFKITELTDESEAALPPSSPAAGKPEPERTASPMSQAEQEQQTAAHPVNEKTKVKDPAAAADPSAVQTEQTHTEENGADSKTSEKDKEKEDEKKLQLV